jgi:hypothetical protein
LKIWNSEPFSKVKTKRNPAPVEMNFQGTLFDMGSPEMETIQEKNGIHRNSTSSVLPG